MCCAELGRGAGEWTSAAMAPGPGSREIAGRLVISVRTVDNHLQNGYRKLGVTRREDLPRVLSGTPE
jgi:DNA-binding NarL/FixJ family response regulator